MAAGKMYNATRKRTYKRRASGFRKAVTAIARKATLSVAEHKYAVGTSNNTFGVNGLLIPMFANITQGDGQANRDGDQIRSTGVLIRGQIGMDTTIITGLQDYNGVRVFVCSGKRPLTTGDMPGWKDAIDHERLNVLSDTYIQFSTTKRTLFFKKYIKFPRVIPYEGSVPNKNEMYLWVVPIGGTGITTTTGNFLNTTYHIGFKDV